MAAAASRAAAQAVAAVVTGNTMPSLTNYFTDGSAVPNPGQGGFAVIKDGQPYLIGGEATGSLGATKRPIFAWKREQSSPL